MKLSQSLRRLQWRARRLFLKPADNSPLVEVENRGAGGRFSARPTPPVVKQARKRATLGRTVRRAVWLLAAFLATLAVLGAVYVWFVARESRVSVLVDPRAIDAKADGSAAIGAAAAMVEEATHPVDPLADQDLLLAPTARRAREVWLNDGAASAVARFLEAIRLGRSDDALTEARFALADGAPGRQKAKAALVQVNDRLARRATWLDVGDAAHIAMLGAAADQLGAEAEALLAAQPGKEKRVVAPQADAFFFRGRGVALGWRRLLEGWVSEGPPRTASARRASLQAAFASLEAAAQFQPTLIVNARPDSSFQPNHLSHLAALLSVSAFRLRAAAQGAQAP